MTDIMIQISVYIFAAIVLGYFFGWLITKVLLKERYQSHLDAIVLDNQIEKEDFIKIKDELFQIKKENKLLKVNNKELNSGYDGQKYVLDEYNETLDDFQRRLLSKDEVIESLTSQLSELEEKQLNIKKKYEEEIDAFIFERIEITQKYKDVLEKLNLLKGHKSLIRNQESWLSKFFSSSSPSVSVH